MDNSNYLKLDLSQAVYFPSSFNLSSESLKSSLDEVEKDLNPSKVGTDSIIACKATLTSEICVFNVYKAAFRHTKDNANGGITLNRGLYKFYQLPDILRHTNSIIPLLNRFALSLDFSNTKEREIFIRIYKEAPNKSVVQFFAPMQTKEE
jgi:hypothetical protein